MSRPFRASFLLSGVAWFVMLAACAGRSGPARWTFQGEQTVLTYHGSDPSNAGPPTVVRVWFAPGVGWREEISATTASSVTQRISGSDGRDVWEYDSASNQYTREHRSGLNDPRALALAGEFGLPFTYDLKSALAVSTLYPNSARTREGREAVAGRATERVLVTPAGCTLGAAGSGSATSAPTTTCAWSARYWFDEKTGWALRVEGDRVAGGEQSYIVNTSNANFNAHIDRTLFTLTPPPGSVKVDSLN